MIVQLNITNDRAAKILDAIGQPYQRATKTEFRNVAHNATKEIEVEVIMVKIGENHYLPAKEWIEETLNNGLLDILKHGVNINK